MGVCVQGERGERRWICKGRWGEGGEKKEEDNRRGGDD